MSKRTQNCRLREFLEIEHDKNHPERSDKLSVYTYKMAKFVARIDKHYEQQHKNENRTFFKKNKFSKIRTEITNKPRQGLD